MKFHYCGKYDLNPDNLPQREHPEGSVQFKEPEDTQKLSAAANGIAFAAAIVLLLPVCQIYGFDNIFGGLDAMIACILAIIAMIPHELLHALCFKKDVYMYENLRQGLMFVVGTEDMSRGRFIFMSLLPCIVLGIVPYIAGFAAGSMALLLFGAVNAASAGGDFINVYNCLTQVPKGALVYMSGIRSYWYVPEHKA